MLNASAMSPKNANRVTEKSKLERKIKQNKFKSNDLSVVLQQRRGTGAAPA